MRTERLDWRHDREEHIARHGVSREEVEEAVFDDRAGMLLRQGTAQRNPDETGYQHLGGARRSGAISSRRCCISVEERLYR
ncbi:MAG: hypothetical protein WA990_11865 [Rubrobacteraceae bacterium]